MGLNLITRESDDEPVTLQEVRDFCNFPLTDRDDEFRAHIRMARERIEGVVHRQLMTATWELYLDRFPGTTGSIYLTDHCARPPFQTVNSIVYMDIDGVEQTVTASDYSLSSAPESGRITLAYNTNWPSTRQIAEAVTIEFNNGHGDSPADVPEIYKGIIKTLVLMWWRKESPVGELPQRITELLWQNRRVA